MSTTVLLGVLALLYYYLIYYYQRQRQYWLINTGKEGLVERDWDRDYDEVYRT